MLNDKNSFNHDNRNLSEVFRELQEMQKNPNSQANNYKKYEKEQKSKRKKELSSISHAQNIRDSFRQERRVKTNDLKLSQIIIGCGILIVGLAVFFPKSASFQESYAKEVENIRFSCIAGCKKAGYCVAQYPELFRGGNRCRK